ncbi:protein brambleberry-like [Coccinella septempunctata]|uniref:protein brambleberry-like n=1 Tax=Coccinella septempunctata TaxID=41139 RepID=UPI001D060CA1|nr:protein brambleberry-like [Coccinella septempunctata]
MFFNIKSLSLLVVLLINFERVTPALNDYIKDWGRYFGYGESEKIDDFNQNIPYEVATMDEKFISEAAKLTGVALSELDSCQQRVILKLKTDCHKLNDEQLAKLAVHLLNCQSYVEGRPTYPCTEEMSIKECTTVMDSDTWTIYHLMSNRARAVCYMIRQTQFRGLAESTVNRLMDAAKHQIDTLDKIMLNQENLHSVASETFDSLSKGHDILSQQQKDLHSAQFHGQLAIEENIARLVDEKRIIAETHNKLISLTKDLQEKIGDSKNQLQIQSTESKLNHQELIRDLILLQEQTQEIFRKIEESSQLLLTQSKEFRDQYDYTLKNLIEVNKTVHSLVSLVGGTKKALEERLQWVSTALGGTDLAIERLYLILWHLAFFLFGMIGSAFLDVDMGIRLIVILLPSFNLAIGIYGQNQHLEPLHLLAVIGGLAILQGFISWILNYKKTPKANPQMIKYDITPEKSSGNVENNIKNIYSEKGYVYPDVTSSEYYSSKNLLDEPTSDNFNEFGSPTPPLSRSGYYKSRSRSRTPNLLGGKESCHAKTRLGTPCKLSCLPGRDFCYRHQAGDSIAGR